MWFFKTSKYQYIFFFIKKFIYILLNQLKHSKIIGLLKLLITLM